MHIIVIDEGYFGNGRLLENISVNIVSTTISICYITRLPIHSPEDRPTGEMRIKQNK